jgi:hypothetical protein
MKRRHNLARNSVGLTIALGAIVGLGLGWLAVQASGRDPIAGLSVTETGDNTIGGVKLYRGTVEVAWATGASNPVPLSQAQALIAAGGVTLSSSASVTWTQPTAGVWVAHAGNVNYATNSGTANTASNLTPTAAQALSNSFIHTTVDIFNAGSNYWTVSSGVLSNYHTAWFSGTCTNCSLGVSNGVVYSAISAAEPGGGAYTVAWTNAQLGLIYLVGTEIRGGTNYSELTNFPNGLTINGKAIVDVDTNTVPAFEVVLHANQTNGSAGAWVQLNFDVVTNDTRSGWSAAGHYYKAPKAGYYHLWTEARAGAVGNGVELVVRISGGGSADALNRQDGNVFWTGMSSVRAGVPGVLVYAPDTNAYWFVETFASPANYYLSGGDAATYFGGHFIGPP